MQRLLLTLVAIAAVGLVASGCGKGEEVTSEPTPKTTGSAPEATKTGEPKLGE